MSVSLHPSSALGFNRPLTELVKRTLSITNNNSQPVAFKVKTTAPKLYCVRPNSGRIEPGENVEVSVMLQAMKEEPPVSVKCKDKFLIQSTIITPEKETRPLQDIWNTSESGEDAKVHQQKLRVVYLPPEGQTLEEEEEPQQNPAPAPLPSHITPGAVSVPLSHINPAQYETVRQHPEGNGHPVEAINVFPPERERSLDDSQTQPQQQERDRPYTPPATFSAAREELPEEPSVGVVNVNVHTPPPPAPPAASIPPVEPQVNEDFLSKFNAALAENERLRALLAAVPDPSSPPTSLAPTELRRRNKALSDDGSTVADTDLGTYVDEGTLQHPEGVPLQVVVIIALGVFITTYLFF